MEKESLPKERHGAMSQADEILRPEFFGFSAIEACCWMSMLPPSHGYPQDTGFFSAKEDKDQKAI